MNKIFIVEDDKNIKDLIIYALENEGFKTEGFLNSNSLYNRLKEVIPQLLILDIMIPGDDGFKVLKNLRNNQRTKDLPVIIITAKTSEYHRVKGLDLGADDYILKPFSIIEMVSRVNALLRRYNIYKNNQVKEKKTLEMVNIVLDLNKRLVTIDDKKVSLTFKEFELLKYLMENENIVLTRNMIMSHVWDFDFEGESRTIDVHIRSLRQKLGDSAHLIQTVRNVGYKMGEI